MIQKTVGISRAWRDLHRRHARPGIIRKRTDGPFSTVRTVRSLSITTPNILTDSPLEGIPSFQQKLQLTDRTFSLKIEDMNKLWKFSQK